MQYKIPIQIENEDNIIFGLSLRQLGIIIVGVIIAYGVFTKFENSGLPLTVLFVACVCIAGVFVFIAKFKSHEMGFLSFLLNLTRWKVNGNGPDGKGRYWLKGVDSESVVRVGYVRHPKKEKEIEYTSLSPDQAHQMYENISKL